MRFVVFGRARESSTVSAERFAHRFLIFVVGEEADTWKGEKYR